MVIEWLGHSCFKINTENGITILFDPYDYTVGYPQQDVKANIVIISHDHYDHSDLSHVHGDYSVINKPGSYEYDGLTIEGIKTWHDCEQGQERGENMVSLLSIDGINLCHMGDIGCIPSDDVIQKLEAVDVLMIPVGGNYTIDAQEALEICEKLSPNIIIPMHFKTPVSTLNISPLDDFLEAAGREYDVSHHGKCYLNVDKTSLKKRTRIVVMEYL